MKIKLLAVALCVLPIIACSSETTVNPTPPAGEGTGTGTTDPNATPTTANGTVGAEGGSVEAGDVILEVPAGALAEETTITITKTEDAVPERHVGVTPIYKLEPDGLKFKKAAKLTFKKLPAETVAPVIGLQRGEGIFEGQKTTAAEDTATASITKLAAAFVATRDCQEADGTSKTVCKATPAPADLDSGRNINGFSLTGFEYWQWKKPDPYKGGDEVAWGYNGDGVPKTGVVPTDQSRACMAEAFRVLENILASPPQELKDLKAATAEKGGVHQFWFWNNDMTDAKASVKVPKNDAELWLYAGDRGDGGLVKWISSTERDGVCHLPNLQDLITFSKACKTAFPGCGSGK